MYVYCSTHSSTYDDHVLRRISREAIDGCIPPMWSKIAILQLQLHSLTLFLNFVCNIAIPVSYPPQSIDSVSKSQPRPTWDSPIL